MADCNLNPAGRFLTASSLHTKAHKRRFCFWKLSTLTERRLFSLGSIIRRTCRCVSLHLVWSWLKIETFSPTHDTVRVVMSICWSLSLEGWRLKYRIIVHLHEILNRRGPRHGIVMAIILLWLLFNTIVNDAFMSVLSTTSSLFWLYYLQSSWPHSKWLCVNSLASACSRFTLNEIDTMNHTSLNKSTFEGSGTWNINMN